MIKPDRMTTRALIMEQDRLVQLWREQERSAYRSDATIATILDRLGELERVRAARMGASTETGADND